MLYCIVGPSGSGKSTIVEKLNKMGYKSPDSYTTRPKRSEDEKGHTFITEEEFDKLENMVAFTVFNGYRYCVTKEMLEGCDFYIIDPAGVKTLRKSGIEFKVIGLAIDPIDCIERMSKRGDKDEDISSRVLHDQEAFKDFLKECDYVIDATQSEDKVIQDIINLVLGTFPR